MYRIIEDHPTVRQIYVERLKRRGTLTDAEAVQTLAAFREELEYALEDSQTEMPRLDESPAVADAAAPPETAISIETANRRSSAAAGVLPTRLPLIRRSQPAGSLSTMRLPPRAGLGCCAAV